MHQNSTLRKSCTHPFRNIDHLHATQSTERESYVSKSKMSLAFMMAMDQQLVYVVLLLTSTITNTMLGITSDRGQCDSP